MGQSRIRRLPCPHSVPLSLPPPPPHSPGSQAHAQVDLHKDRGLWTGRSPENHIHLLRIIPTKPHSLERVGGTSKPTNRLDVYWLGGCKTEVFRQFSDINPCVVWLGVVPEGGLSAGSRRSRRKQRACIGSLPEGWLSAGSRQKVQEETEG